MNGQQDGKRDGNSGNVEDIYTEMSPLKKQGVYGLSDTGRGKP